MRRPGDTISVSTWQLPLRNLLPHLQTNTGEQLHASARTTAERVRVPAAAVAEWPEGKELEEGVFTRGAISVSEIKGRARSNRYFAPSATNQEMATDAHGTRR